MTLHGHFENGVVVLDEGTPLPDGTFVTIREQESVHTQVYFPPGPRGRIQFPLVPSDKPGSLSNTHEEFKEMAYGDNRPS